MARPRRIVTRGPRRLTQWIGPPLQGGVAVASGGATIISSLVLEEPVTLVRTRGSINITLASFASDQNINGAIGMGVVSAEALAAGVASVPEPYTDADWGGWFVWRSFGYSIEFGDATGIQAPTDRVIEIDSKAMRKVGPNDAFVLVAESFLGAYEVTDGTRQLLKLS